MKKYFRIAVLAFFLLPSRLRAADEPAHVHVTLIPEAKTIVAGTPFWVAVRLKMDDKWHTYWKNPGDSGEPTKILWSLPAGFTAGDIQWPYPERIEAPPLVSFGYLGDAPLLVRITPPANLKAGTHVPLKAKVEWLECQDICIPGEATVEASVTAGPQAENDPGQAKFFADARARLPLEPGEWMFNASAGTGFVRLSAMQPAWLKESISSAQFFPDDNGLFKYDATPWRRTRDGYSLDLVKSDLSTGPITALNGVLVSRDGWRGKGSEHAIRVRATVSGTANSPMTKPAKGLLTALIFSFIGGLILNLMPCVLPVLSIKVLSLVGQAGAPTSVRLRNAGAYVLGVLIAFWSLAGALLALRAGGEQLGWGFQLQSPPVIAALASLFFLISLNLFGVFEIGVSLTRFGGASGEGPGASFSSGLLATVVATPCTAPFMGSALGFALTQPAWAAIAIFTSLGAGMAAPFVVLAASPALLKFLPKPGAWMETMKQALGFLLAATVVWLAWVLGRQTGAEAIVILLGALLLQSVGAWIFGKWANLTRTAGVRAVALAFALLFIGGGVAAAVFLTKAVPPSNAAAEKTDWQPYSEARVAELRAAGKPVFVDFGAAWCLTCQVNERVALNAAPVVAKMKEKGIVPLKADWTSRDPAITAALGKLGRSGVPTYVLYPSDPNAPPQVLSEILTPTYLVQALDQAR